MTKKEIEAALNGSKKPFNSVHYQYPTKDKTAQSTPVTDDELRAALQDIK